MTKKSLFLRSHLDFLLARDPNFRRLWSDSSTHERSRFVSTALAIENVCPDNLAVERFGVAHDTLKRRLVTVQERQLLLTRIPRDWPQFILSDERRTSLYSVALRKFSTFVGRFKKKKVIRLYGGLKSLDSIDPQRFKSKQESEIQKAIEDTWDAVRFRIVVENVAVLRELSMRLWEVFFDDVIRCRNYYYQPKAGSLLHPYRAVHFQLAVREGYPVELQVMTLNSEVVSHLEHAVLFKRRIVTDIPPHLEWLKMLCYKPLILDAVHSNWRQETLPDRHQAKEKVAHKHRLWPFPLVRPKDPQT